MTWTQNYNPAGHWLLSTLLAAIPVLILLSALAIFRIKAHFAALLGLAASLAHRLLDLRHAIENGRDVRRLRHPLRPLPHRLDRPQRHLHVRPHLRSRPLQSPPAKPHGHHAGPPPPARPHRLRLRRLLRGRLRLRHSRSSHRRHPHRHRFQAVAGFRTIADRQHRARRLRRPRHSADRALRRQRSQPPSTQRHDRPNSSVFFSPRSVLADLDFRRFRRNDRSLARHARRRTFLRRPAIPDFKSSRPLARRCRRIRLLHRRSHGSAAVLASETHLGTRRPRIRSRRARRARPRALRRN